MSDDWNKTGREAASSVADTVQVVKETAADAAGRVGGMARQAGEQASAAAQSLYGQGNDILAVLDRTVVENPLSSLLVAGSIGFALAWMIQRH